MYRFLKFLDKSFREYQIKEVREGETHYNISYKGHALGYSLRKRHGVVPKVGDTIRVYSHELFSPVYGVDLNGREVFYKASRARL